MSDDSSKTVGRAAHLLFELADNPDGLTVTELAKLVNTQRAPLYRLLRTLSAYRLIRRDQNKLYFLSAGVLELARAVAEPLGTLVRPVLQDLADSTNTTAMLVLSEGDALVTALNATPDTGEMHITTTIGFRHPDGPIATRIAIMAGRPASPDDDPTVVEARRKGYATSASATMVGRFGIAAPVALGPSHPEGCILLVTFREKTEAELAPHLTRAAALISSRFTVQR